MILLLACQPPAAEEPQPAAAEGPLCPAAVTEADARACFRSPLRDAEAAMAEGLDAAAASDGSRVRLEASQAAWEAMTEAWCALATDAVPTVTAYHECRLARTRARTAEILAWSELVARAGLRPRCPAGVQRSGFWSGEYPGPVVEVVTEATLRGREDPCEPAATVACTVPPGIYHPWATTVADFDTLTPVVRYRAAAAGSATGDDGRPVSWRAGDVVEIPTYRSEGTCEWRVAGVEFSMECPREGFEELPPANPGFVELQVLGVGCREGRRAWLDVDVLMATEGVRAGAIVRYGEVGPGR